MSVFPVRELTFPGPLEIQKPPASNLPLVIDNGSCQLRAGWGGEQEPRLVFDNLVSRYRDRKLSRTSTLVGYDTLIEPGARSIAKSPFENGLINNWDVFEMVMDYTLLKLGVKSLDHPVCMTEPLLNPRYNRLTMTELMFELYNAPSVSYGIDSMFSAYHNLGDNASGIVLDFGNSASSVIPFINGHGVLSKAKRISWGGSQAASYLLNLFQLKYPSFPLKMVPSQAQLLFHDHCRVSPEFISEIKVALNRDYLDKNDIIVQFPYQEALAHERSEQELARIAERKRESGRRLQAQAAEKRREKQAERERELESALELQKESLTLPQRAYQKALEKAGFADDSELASHIRTLQTRIRKSQHSQTHEDTDAASETTEVDSINENSFPLLSIPDDQLSENELRQKRHQRLMKANYDARIRAKAEKAKELAAEQQRLEEDRRLREEEFPIWVTQKREQYSKLLYKLSENKRLRKELNDRKSHASQMRMKNLANLVSERPTHKRRRRTNQEDNFGANDEDWSAYRDVMTADQLDSEIERLMEEIYALEKQLLEYDTEFTDEQTYDVVHDPKKTLIYAYTHGNTDYDSSNVAQNYQLHLNVERIRVPEIVFRPSIAGLDQAGVIEIIRTMLQDTELNVDNKLMSNILLTGGMSLLPGFVERIKNELKAILPTGTALNVKRAQDPSLDAWKGASSWSVTEKFKQSCITREEFTEKGMDYIKEHALGNPV
ncbi:actin-like protein Arp5 [Schizosaccharomyces japonicus yFS275]|uniref:Actin-like protein Arp5 n=1 Tax=Schizosaccharomyces japonicus (strain yFS275 / FY16936) TaxID=402676 RepID=B6K570_SCHJY|nr:actin-like protein Arp5 [Schizosaccharomyces japonicus yFS275]EEB08674.1 actin-like protein Arp5 [Schizosaccharomyces japonicus yFS275]